MEIHQRDTKSFFLGMLMMFIVGGSFAYGYYNFQSWQLFKSIPWCSDKPNTRMTGTLPSGAYWACEPVTWSPAPRSKPRKPAKPKKRKG